jgi:predicted PurR-regulated permease PerM
VSYPDVALIGREAASRDSGRGRTLLAAGAIVVLALLAWRLADVLMLAFGAVLTAVLLQALAEPLARRAGVPRPWALAAAVLILVLGSAAALWLFGHEAARQLTALGEILPRAWTSLQARLSTSPIGVYVLHDLQRLRQLDGLLIELGPGLLRGVAGAGAGTVIVLFAGLYLAFHPRTYVGGLLLLAPRRLRARWAQVLDACGHALNRWLVGQLVSMALVGATTGVGLWLAGVPSLLALGVIAGLAQFVPVVGPMASVIPGLVVAAGQGPETFGWAALVYVAAMQFEANVITPLVLRQMVALPMAVTLFAVLAMGVLFGPLGVLFATPLAVVAYVVVRMIYVEDVLGDHLEPLGGAR